jgi:hypothetical protein
MTQQDQDVENKLKCLNMTELTELLDFILPNRPRDLSDDQNISETPTNAAPRTH